jgi:hypothetical protein
MNLKTVVKHNAAVVAVAHSDIHLHTQATAAWEEVYDLVEVLGSRDMAEEPWRCDAWLWPFCTG